MCNAINDKEEEKVYRVDPDLGLQLNQIDDATIIILSQAPANEIDLDINLQYAVTRYIAEKN